MADRFTNLLKCDKRKEQKKNNNKKKRRKIWKLRTMKFERNETKIEFLKSINFVDVHR